LQLVEILKFLLKNSSYCLKAPSTSQILRITLNFKKYVKNKRKSCKRLTFPCFSINIRKYPWKAVIKLSNACTMISPVSHLCCCHYYRLWYVGLTCMLRGIRKQISLIDRSMLWLKELYIQLYYENGGCEPLASDAIRVCVSIGR
jgi:hypothetical protein